MKTPAPLPIVLDRITSGAAPEALTCPRVARLAASYDGSPDDPEVTARCLAVAWSAFERHRDSPPEEKRMFLAKPACTAMCDRCDMQCAVIASGVRRAYHIHQQALQASGGALFHDGRFYSIPAGRA